MSTLQGHMLTAKGQVSTITVSIAASRSTGAGGTVTMARRLNPPVWNWVSSYPQKVCCILRAWPGASSRGALSTCVCTRKPSLRSGSWNEQSIFLDKEGEQHVRKCFSLAFQELLGFLWQHLDQGHGAHPPADPEARPLAANTEIPRPAALLPGLTSGSQVTYRFYGSMGRGEIFLPCLYAMPGCSLC